MYYFKVSISFSSKFVLSRRMDDVLPAEAAAKFLMEKYEAKCAELVMLGCKVNVKDEGELTKDEILDAINAFLNEKYALSPGEDGEFVEYDISIEHMEGDISSDILPDDDDYDEDYIEGEEKSNNPITGKPASETIAELVGADEFKALCSELTAMTPIIKKYNTFDVFARQSYIFAINDGYGHSTYLKLFAGLISELGLLKLDEKNPVMELKPIAGDNEAERERNLINLLPNSMYRTKAKVISIDISDWMSRVHDKCFREFLSRLVNYIGENIVVLRVPFVEGTVLNDMKKKLGDYLFVRDISFIPFDNAELREFAKQTLAEKKFEIEEDAWDVFNARVFEEKSDGRFYGINTVNKIVDEMIYRKQQDNAISGVDDCIIKKHEILKLANSYEGKEKTGMELLDDYVGVEDIKKRVEEIVAQIEMSAKNPRLGNPCIHMRFIGNPGTGKTTIARVIGKILKEKGILRNGDFYEYSGRDFCGRYVGETAPKTSSMCRDAYGSVLFIDEAYSLFRGDGFSQADYGREAIDTLVAEMENHRSDLVVIMAGYPDDMEKLMEGNSGLASRMPYTLEFPNYDREQLQQIFMKMVTNVFECDQMLAEAVREYFESIPDEILSSKTFSNARFVRNLFERTCGKATLRTQISRETEMRITKNDFTAACADKEFQFVQEPSKPLGFI